MKTFFLMFAITIGTILLFAIDYDALAADFDRTPAPEAPLTQIGEDGALKVYTFKDHGHHCYVTTRVNAVSITCGGN